MTNTYDVSQVAFANAGLPIPPVPEPLRDTLQQEGKLAYSTGENSGKIFIADVIEQIAAGTQPDFVSFAYLGHGINSYTLQYDCLYNGTLLNLEQFIGGALADQKSNIAQTQDLLNHVGELFAAVADAREAGRIGADEIIFVRDDLAQQLWQRFDRTAGLAGLNQAKTFKHPNPLQAAIHALSG